MLIADRGLRNLLLFIIFLFGTMHMAVADDAAATPPGSPAATSTGGEPQAKTVQVARFAPSGRLQQVIKMTIAQPDCSSGGIPAWRVTKPAEHGQMIFETTDQFPDFVANTPRAQCNDKKMPGVKVSYKSEDNFNGMDSADVLFVYPDGSAVVFHLTIKVI